MARRRVYHRQTRVTWYGDDFLKIVRDHGDEALFAAGQIVLKAAERRAPVGKTGNLRKSGYVSTASRSTYVKRRYWRKEKKPPVGAATVAFTAPHAHLIEGGRRRSGKIVPLRRRRGRSRKALFFEGRFAARSRFKRTHSHPFLGPAVEETKETMVQELAKTYRSWLERALPSRSFFGK